MTCSWTHGQQVSISKRELLILSLHLICATFIKQKSQTEIFILKSHSEELYEFSFLGTPTAEILDILFTGFSESLIYFWSFHTLERLNVRVEEHGFCFTNVNRRPTFKHSASTRLMRFFDFSILLDSKTTSSANSRSNTDFAPSCWLFFGCRVKHNSSSLPWIAL